LVETFRRLDIEFSRFANGRPFLFRNESQDEDIPGQGLQIHSPHDVCQTVRRLVHMEVPFLAKCWSLSTAEIEADYDNLRHRQQRILSYAYGVKTQIQSFYSLSYHLFTYNERRRVELSLLQCLAQIVANKTCLFGGLVPADLTSEYVAIFDFYDSVMARFPSDRQSLWIMVSSRPCG
jgi:hypothetical protein